MFRVRTLAGFLEAFVDADILYIVTECARLWSLILTRILIVLPTAVRARYEAPTAC